MLNRRGLKATAVYLDDFFIKEDTLNECTAALIILVHIVRKLSFQINWNKVADPTTKLTFLGNEIDSVNITLRLPDEKLHQVRDELALFQKRTRASKKQLQSLAGKLNFCASVVYGGRGYSRRIIDTFNALKASNHKAKLNDDIRADISWWQFFMHAFNGRSMLLDKQPITSVFTDSCKSAAGGVYDGNWFYLNWDIDWPQISNMHINVKEAMAVYLAVYRWAPLWRNHYPI